MGPLILYNALVTIAFLSVGKKETFLQSNFFSLKFGIRAKFSMQIKTLIKPTLVLCMMLVTFSIKIKKMLVNFKRTFVF